MHSGPQPDPLPDPPSAPFPAGRRVGTRYEIVRPLGRGGFAHTYLARDLERGRDVALKTLRSRAVTDLKAYQLFEREATVLLGLRHRGVPEFVEFFRADVEGEPAAVLVMEYIEGRTLSGMIDEGAVLAPLQVLDLALELLAILDYLHTRVPPILHRDIKPANVILRPDGSPVLVDFGAVRNVFRAPGESGSTVIGTHGYMPYEQYMGRASPASDLYALGATLLHLVTARSPSDFMAADGRIEVPAALPAGAPLRAVIARMLDPAPANRFTSARDARAALLASASSVGKPGAVPGAALVRAAPATPATLGPAPRALEGETRTRYRQVAHGMWRLMDPTSPPDERHGVTDILSLALFSLLTAGVLPVVFFGVARSRKRRLRRFFREGIPGMAELVDFRPEDIAFGVKHTRVRYEFEADGAVHRGSDVVLPVIADRWRAGDRIEILYLPARDYDSVIIEG